jgi:hypothetical protein
LTVAAAAVVLMLQMRPTPSVVSPAMVPVTSTAEAGFEDDGSWDIVMGLASGIAWDDIATQ